MYYFTRFKFNKIAFQATVQMAANKDAVGLSRVHMYRPLRVYYMFYDGMMFGISIDNREY